MKLARLKRNISRIIPFGFIWLLFGVIFLTIEYASTNRYAYKAEGVIAPDSTVLIFALTAVTIVGFFIGIIELVLVSKLFKNESFVAKFFGKLFVYSVFLFLVICISYPIASSIELNTSIFDPIVKDNFIKYLNSLAFFSTGFQMTVSLIFTLFYNEINEKIGSKAFLNFIIGKYHSPSIENRIFMFLDMKSSTTIAEKIGHFSYFNFLKDYFDVLSNAVVDNHGDVYQYVGDEVIISWKLNKGLENNNCINCFFDMKDDLKNNQTYFVDTYGISPQFKAGIHYGEVTTGEIGKIKKDIIFTGDILNTTARIQSLCNELSVDVLLSSQLFELLSLDPKIHLRFLGKKQLRGKTEVLELYTLSRA